MSSSFDMMGQAFAFIREHLEKPVAPQVQAVCHYFARAIERLHDLNHNMHDELNHDRLLYKETEALRTCMQHEDDERRDQWLKIKGLR